MRSLELTLVALVVVACDPPMAGEPLADPLPGQDRYTTALFGAGTQACVSHNSVQNYSQIDERVDCLGEGPLGALPPLLALPAGATPRGAASYVGLADGGVQVTQLLGRWDQNSGASDYPVQIHTLAPTGWEQRLVIPPSLNPDAGWVGMPGYSTATTADGEVFITLDNGSLYSLVDGGWVDRSITDGRRAVSLTSGADGRAYALLGRDDGRGSMVEWLDGRWVDVSPEAFDLYGGYYGGDDARTSAAGGGRYLRALSGYSYGYYGSGLDGVKLQLFSIAGLEDISPPKSLVPSTYNFAVTLTDSGDPVMAAAAADGIRVVIRSGGQWSVLAEGLAGGAGPRRQSAVLVRSIAGRLVVAWTEQEQPPYPLGVFSRGGPARVFVRRL